MKITLRNIGNSRGIIIPAALIEPLHIENEVELTLQADSLLLKPSKPLRKGRILLDQIRTVDKKRLKSKMGEIPVGEWHHILMQMLS